MAALNRPRVANYTISESFEIDTRDHEDHTFCGVMFTIQCSSSLPVEFLEITSVAIRGELGPLTVWVTQGTWRNKHEDADQWTKVYEKEHAASRDKFVTLKFDSPVYVFQGDSIGVYVHSRAEGDQAIVYDNQKGAVTHQDEWITVGPGLAHLSNEPFSPHGWWGTAWRARREFVGQIAFGIKYLLWNPEAHMKFPRPFKRLAMFFLLIKPQENCPLSWLSNDILFYILNLCRYDWVDFPPLPGEIEPRSEAEMNRETAMGLKHEGNEAVVSGDLDVARAKYLAAIETLTGEGNRDVTLGTDEDRRLFALINQNLSLVELRSGNWIAAAQAADLTLSMDTCSSKALFRRGTAYARMGLLREAVRDLIMARNFSPNDRTIYRELRSVIATLEAEHVLAGGDDDDEEGEQDDDDNEEEGGDGDQDGDNTTEGGAAAAEEEEAGDGGDDDQEERDHATFTTAGSSALPEYEVDSDDDTHPKQVILAAAVETGKEEGDQE